VQRSGYGAGKQIKGRKRFMTVDTLGLVLRVWGAAANVPEREDRSQKTGRQRDEDIQRWLDQIYAPVSRLVNKILLSLTTTCKRDTKCFGLPLVYVAKPKPLFARSPLEQSV
jgi:hypothetical protein